MAKRNSWRWMVCQLKAVKRRLLNDEQVQHRRREVRAQPLVPNKEEANPGHFFKL
jgi:hypothetical protein